ncbi:MAG: CHAT domain-containing protein, partial [Bacteroidota bacterium]
RFIPIAKDTILTHHMNQLINSFQVGRMKDDESLAYDQFRKSSHILYTKLLAPLVDKLENEEKKLTIMPDGQLAYIPWEVLTTLPPTPTDQVNYRNLPYFFRDYVVSYGHSATVTFHDFDYKPAIFRKNAVLAMAPTYLDSKEMVATTAVFRDTPMPLKWNSQEVRQLSRYFKGKFLTGSDATEKAFKKWAGDYSVLHLAVHGQVDPNNSMKSGLLFENEEGDTEDGLLHIHEILKLNLSMDLAVLSACNTGFGKQRKGEGIMSLGRAFAYAGCPSVVMSHWPVPDKSTAHLMGYFYQALVDGMPKDEALRFAKLSFLDKEGQMNDHPLYWAGFFVMGDTRPLSKGFSSVMIWSIIAVALVFLVVMIVLRKKSARSVE